MVDVHDPADGRTVYHAPLAGGERPKWMLIAAGGTAAAGLRGCNLLVFRWTGRAFSLAKEHPAPAGLCFDYARFRDGRFRIEVKRQASPRTTDRNPWFTLDPAAPETLRQEEPTDSVHFERLTVAGHTDTATATMFGNEQRIASLEVNGGPTFHYRCEHRSRTRGSSARRPRPPG